jgi:hypothetical protein
MTYSADMLRTFSFWALLSALVCLSVSVVFLQIVRDVISEKLIAVHRLDLLPHLSRQGSLPTSIYFLPIKRVAVLGHHSIDIFCSIGLLGLKPVVLFFWVLGEFSFWIMFAAAISMAVWI